MTEHTHTVVTPGCYRCELGRDEEISALADDYFDAHIAQTYRDAGVPRDHMHVFRSKYERDVRNNPEAIKQLYAWAETRDDDD